MRWGTRRPRRPARPWPRPFPGVDNQSGKDSTDGEGGDERGEDRPPQRRAEPGRAPPAGAAEHQRGEGAHRRRERELHGERLGRDVPAKPHEPGRGELGRIERQRPRDVLAQDVHADRQDAEGRPGEAAQVPEQQARRQPHEGQQQGHGPGRGDQRRVQRRGQRGAREPVEGRGEAEAHRRVEHQHAQRDRELVREQPQAGEREPVEEPQGAVVLLAHQEARADGEGEHELQEVQELGFAQQALLERVHVQLAEERVGHLDRGQHQPQPEEGRLVPQLLAQERAVHGASQRRA